MSGLALTPNGRFLYAANNSEVGNDQGITAFAISATTGALTPLTPSVYLAPPFPDDLRVSGDGRNLYMTDGFGLRGYTIGDDGSLTEVPGSPYALSSTETLGLAVAPTPTAPEPPPPTPSNPPAPPAPASVGTATTTTTTPTLPALPLAAPPGPASGPMRLLGDRRLRFVGGRARIRVRCGTGASVSQCSATLRLRARLGRSVHTVARRTLDLGAASAETVTLRLSSSAWRALGRGGALRAALLLTPEGRTTLADRVRLLGPRGP